MAATVRHVALSTTLATNAIVEGHGAPIGVVLIGFDAEMAVRTGIAQALPGTPMLRAAGGHDHAGDAAAPLDEAAITDFLHATRAQVAAYAVAGQYAVRNPEHELRAQALIEAITGHPATSRKRARACAGRAAPRADGGAERAHHRPRHGADRGGAAGARRPRDRRTAVRGEGRRHAGTRRADRRAADRDHPLRPRRQHDRGKVPVRACGSRRRRHRRHDHRHRGAGRRLAAARSHRRAGGRASHAGAGDRDEHVRPRRRQRGAVGAGRRCDAAALAACGRWHCSAPAGRA